MAKISVGLIQAWMIFELAMRMRFVNDEYLRYASYVMMTLIIISFCVCSIIICTVLIKNSDGNIYKDNKEFLDKKVRVQSFTFLALSIIMLILNIDLIVQMKKKERAMLNSLKREKCVLVTVLVCFELSYFFRFLLNL